MQTKDRMSIKRIKRWISEEQGAAAVIVALSLSFLLVFSALSLDYGMSYVKTAQAQNAADAAALAAGKLLPISTVNDSAISNAEETAISYAYRNGKFTISAENVTFENVINGRFTSVKVSIPCQSEVFIGKVFGASSVQFVRSAEARVAPCVKATNVAPLGIDKEQLENAIAAGKTQHLYLKYGDGDGENGSYGAIDLDGVKGGGANDFNSWLNYGYKGTITVGSNLLPVEKGNMAGPTASAISERYLQCTHFAGQGGCTADHFDPNCPRVLKVLVIEKVGTSYIRVVGFAAFVIEEVFGDEVLGSYVKMNEPGEISDSVDWDTTEYGIYNVGLSK